MVDEVPVELLRSALDHALNVAAAGGVEVPVAIRPLVKASKLDAKALRRLLQAIEEAPNFRAEVAARASADNVDEAGLLWLTRTDGWRTRLAELVPQPLDRRFRAVEDKLRRRDARVAALEAELQRLRRQAASSALSAK